MLVQRAIKLDELKGRPYDIRVMIQRKPKGKWVCTAFMVKLGKAKKIVTNYHQGGEIVTIRMFLKNKGYSSEQIQSKINELKTKAIKVANVLSGKRSGMHEMGIDFAYDQKDRLWLIEVNSNHPQFHPLKKLDPSAYWKVKSFAKSYGRYDNGS